jgi:beta-glucanase (GH16 family)
MLRILGGMQASSLLIFSALSFLPLLAEEAPVLPARDPAYKLVWADEFDKEGPPDPKKWSPETGFVRNEELQWYQADNAKCENGLLIIEAKREQKKNPRYKAGSGDWRRNREFAEYTSASLCTAGKAAWTYGRYEIRAKFDIPHGVWPAIWTTGLGPWPHAGEIDLLEYYEGTILANFCWGGKPGGIWSTARHSIERFDHETFAQRFHTWVMEWDEKEIRIYLDGVILNTLDLDSLPADKNPFRKPQAFRLNLAIGSSGGDPSKTAFPQKYEVDYVRVYQKPAAK